MRDAVTTSVLPKGRAGKEACICFMGVVTMMAARIFSFVGKKKKKKETFCKHSAMFAKRNPTIKKKQKCVNARDRTWASEENTLARYRDNHSATLTREFEATFRVFYV